MTCIAELLLNRYDLGGFIQPHFDKPVFEYVIGLSLGSEAVMDFTPQNEGSQPLAVALPPRSMYLLAGEALHVFGHSLRPVVETRWSLTFRTLSPEGLKRLEDSPSVI